MRPFNKFAGLRPSIAWKCTLFAALFVWPLLCDAAGLTPNALRCEYLFNPVGIDETAPRLCWRVRSEERGQKQTGYQILVASTPAALAQNSGDLWNSGQVLDDETTGIVYNGKPLVSGERCYWKVRVWDKDSTVSPWSEPASWSMGLLAQSDWKGEWIGYDKLRRADANLAPFDGAKWIWFAGDKGPKIPKATRIFMSSLNVPKGVEITKAELLVAADDKASFNINGQLVPLAGNSADNVAQRVDVTRQIKTGMNIVRVQVENTSPGPAGLIAKLTVVASFGATNVLVENPTTRNFQKFFLSLPDATYTLVTDGSWRATDKGGANWHNRLIGSTEWPAARVIGDAGCQPWGPLKMTGLFLPPPPFLRTTFEVSKPIRHATLYATALGVVDLHLNGRLVSEDRFTPGWTDYNKRVLYRAYDVTGLLRRGKNALGAILADGWYSGYIGWGHIRDHYGKQPRFRGQLEIEYADGSAQTVATGPDWKASEGPVRSADFLMGELFDAGLVNKWDEPLFNDSHWDAVATGAEMNPLIQAHPAPAVRPFDALKAKSITQPKPGVYVLDMGQNFAGVARLRVSAEAGRRITLRFAERLNPDGTLYTANLRGALATDTYVCRGGGTETWEPRFTFHGFQYVEVTGLENPPGEDTVIGVPLSSATTDVGKFVCSDPMLNRLQKNIYWTQRANFIDIPTDCPQRDERLGWMGDAQVYIRAATLNEDVQAFFTKWLTDVQDGQRKDGEFPQVAPVKVAGDDGGPGWADAGVICPWTLYEVYGDKRILEKHYDSMTRFIEFCKKRSTPGLLPPKDFHCFGDWLNINDDTPKPVICTAYFAYCTKLVARAAEVLGKNGDADKYNALADKIKTAFNKAYVGKDGRIQGDSQTDYALAIAFDLLDAEKQKAAASHLIKNIEKHDTHLTTGFIGTKNLMLALAKIGCDDIASDLIHSDTFPSWGFSIKQGATSIWERWDGWTPEKGFQDPGMNSFAHYSFGAVYQWMVENIGGIRADEPAYKHIIIAPYPDGKITFADTVYLSVNGWIETDWRNNGDAFSLKVSIPANTTATVRVPAGDRSSVLEGGKPAESQPGVKFVRMDDGVAVFNIESGIYHFTSLRRVHDTL